MERKAFSEHKLIEDRVVTGFPAVFGNVDDGGDVIVPGAFTKTLRENGHRLKWLWQHDRFQPPTARVLEAREVGRDELPEEVRSRYPEATGGLMVKREYLDTPRGNEVLAGIKAGAVDEMSFGYDPIAVEFPEELSIAGRRVRRILKEIRLWEMSDVNWGMNAATANRKALDLEALSDDELIQALKEAGRLSGVAAQLVAQDAARARTIEERRRKLALLKQELSLV